MVGEDRSIRPTTIEDIVEELTADSSVKNQLMYELEQTIQLSDWTEKHVDIPKSRRHLSYEQLESSITEGHLYHPCYKARSGFPCLIIKLSDQKENVHLSFIGRRQEEKMCNYVSRKTNRFLGGRIREQPLSSFIANPLISRRKFERVYIRSNSSVAVEGIADDWDSTIDRKK